MYAGISGMKNFQTKLDVIGNNISNVNTSGFKKGRVTFQDMMSQMTSGAQGPTDTRGGVNPAQVGLGSQLGSIDNIHTQGFRQTTNNPLDFALEGDGMFVVAEGFEGNGGNVNLDDVSVSYTRAGNFYLDETGNIVNPQGLYLMGFSAAGEGQTASVINDEEGNPLALVISDEDNIVSVTEVDEEGNLGNNNVSPNTDDTYLLNGEDITITLDETISASINGTTLDVNEGKINPFVTSPINIPDTAQSFSVQTNGTVNYIDENGQTQVAGQVAIANFSNPAGLEKAGSNLFLNSENAGYNGLSIPETEGVASIVSGALEMSNVDLSEEFTEMITAQRGFQANTKIITTSDEILQELVNLKR